MPALPLPPGHAILSWTAPSHPHHHRTIRWYLGCLIVVGGLLVYSIMTAAWSFTALIVLIVALYGWQHRREMPDHRLTITDQGFQFDKRFTPWQLCSGFWTLKGPGYIELHLERQNAIDKRIRIQTGPVDLALLHETLVQFTVERTDRTEDTLDIITRILKI
jgi:hypothetical protein